MNRSTWAPALWRVACSLFGLGLFVWLSVKVGFWFGELYEAYQHVSGTSSVYPPASHGVFVDAALWVMPFSFHAVVLLFVSRLAMGPYWANVARGLRISSCAWLSQVFVILGLYGVDFGPIYKIPAVLIGWSTCALVHWLVGRRQVADDGMKIVHVVAWLVLLWSLMGYFGALATMT